MYNVLLLLLLCVCVCVCVCVRARVCACFVCASVCTFSSCNLGKIALPDMHARLSKRKASAYVSGKFELLCCNYSPFMFTWQLGWLKRSHLRSKCY